MFIPTHANMASAIAETVSTGDGIHVPTFIVGCTWADVFPGARIPYHSWDESRAYFDSSLQTLMKNPITDDNKVSNSFLLGVACHLVSDFFCQAHNFPKYKGTISHLVYEYKLGQEFRQVNLDRLCRSPQGFRDALCLSTPTLLTDYLDRIHRDYLLETPGFKTDLVYSMKAASVFVNSIANCRSRMVLSSAA